MVSIVVQTNSAKTRKYNKIILNMFNKYYFTHFFLVFNFISRLVFVCLNAAKSGY